MPQRSSGFAWLILGILFGVGTLGVLGFGVIAIMHTHKNVRIHEDLFDRDLRELEQLQPLLHLPQNRAKADELHKLLQADLRFLDDYKSDRMVAMMIACSAGVPGLLTVVFLGFFLFKRFR